MAEFSSGRNVQRDAVVTLFHSVKLNVNNPHFLIMQGRINKVVNMKPDEILGEPESLSRGWSVYGVSSYGGGCWDEAV